MIIFKGYYTTRVFMFFPCTMDNGQNYLFFVFSRNRVFVFFLHCTSVEKNTKTGKHKNTLTVCNRPRSNY